MGIELIHRIRKLKSQFFFNDKDLSLEHRLFLSSISVGILLSVFSSIMAVVLAYTTLASIIILFVTFVLIVFYYIAKVKGVIDPIIIPTLTVALCGVFLMWLLTGGTIGEGMLPAFIILVLGLIVLSKSKRIYYLILFIVLTSTVYSIEYLLPNLIIIPNKKTNWLDSLTTTIYSALFIYFIIRFFQKYYSEDKKQAEENEKKFKSYVDNALDAVFLTNIKGRFLEGNQATTEISGFTKEELEQHSIIDILAEESFDEGMAYFKELMEKGSLTCDLWLKHKDGSKRFLSINAKLLSETTILGFAKDITERKLKEDTLQELNIKLEAGRVASLNLLQDVNKEITEHKQTEMALRESEKLLRESQKAANLGSYAWDITTGLWVSSDILDDIFGINKEYTHSFENWSSIIHPEWQEIMSVYVIDEVIGKKERFDKEYKIIRKNDGQERWVHGQGELELDSNNTPIRLFGTIKDITENKLAEEKLKEINENIKRIQKEREKHKAELAKAETAAQIAKATIKTKQQFLANMSHEIRTPMNAIIGFTNVILKTDLTAQQKEYLSAIKLSGDALIVLINDILDLSKVDAGKMSFEQIPFKMAATISTMLQLFELKIQEKNLELITIYDDKIPKVLLGDTVRLHQIVLNLMSNAMKFTSKGKITVGVKLLGEDAKKVNLEFWVSDTGIGIAENKLERIFDHFQQASSSTSRLYGGTGLGLAIVKQLVEAQGGSIRVESKVGKGSSFIFNLAFLKTNAKIKDKTDMHNLDGNIKIKVLVVEDITLNQLLMRTLLDEFGFENDIADNGRIAIEKLQEKKYDVILMDLQMPEMDGYEATKYIRNTMNCKTPIIALTADAISIDLEKSKEFGMDDYIAKPVDERVLYNKIVNLVQNPNTKSGNIKKENTIQKKTTCINLDYLKQHTKSNAKLMMEIISAYLDQTPTLIESMNESLHNKDWKLLYASVHKMIPSFAIIGLPATYENMAKEVQEYAKQEIELDKLPKLVIQLEAILEQACHELTEEINTLKSTT